MECIKSLCNTRIQAKQPDEVLSMTLGGAYEEIPSFIIKVYCS